MVTLWASFPLRWRGSLLIPGTFLSFVLHTKPLNHLMFQGSIRPIICKCSVWWVGKLEEQNSDEDTKSKWILNKYKNTRLMVWSGRQRSVRTVSWLLNGFYTCYVVTHSYTLWEHFTTVLVSENVCKPYITVEKKCALVKFIETPNTACSFRQTYWRTVCVTFYQCAKCWEKKTLII